MSDLYWLSNIHLCSLSLSNNPRPCQTSDLSPMSQKDCIGVRTERSQTPSKHNLRTIKHILQYSNNKKKNKNGEMRPYTTITYQIIDTTEFMIFGNYVHTKRCFKCGVISIGKLHWLLFTLVNNKYALIITKFPISMTSKCLSLTSLTWHRVWPTFEQTKTPKILHFSITINIAQVYIQKYKRKKLNYLQRIPRKWHFFASIDLPLPRCCPRTSAWWWDRYSSFLAQLQTMSVNYFYFRQIHSVSTKILQRHDTTNFDSWRVYFCSFFLPLQKCVCKSHICC